MTEPWVSADVFFMLAAGQTESSRHGSDLEIRLRDKRTRPAIGVYPEPVQRLKQGLRYLGREDTRLREGLTQAIATVALLERHIATDAREHLPAPPGDVKRDRLCADPVDSDPCA